MYTGPNTLAATGTALTLTNTLSLVVLGLALIAASLCVFKLAPRKDRS